MLTHLLCSLRIYDCTWPNIKWQKWGEGRVCHGLPRAAKKWLKWGEGRGCQEIARVVMNSQNWGRKVGAGVRCQNKTAKKWQKWGNGRGLHELTLAAGKGRQ